MPNNTPFPRMSAIMTYSNAGAPTSRCANCFIICDLYLPLCNEKNKQREGLEDLSLFNPALPYPNLHCLSRCSRI